jgi:hypothetical protein
MKMTSSEVDAFNTLVNLMKQAHDRFLNERDTYIQLMYKLLIENGYTRMGAINAIYPHADIYTPRETIEMLTKDIKVDH